MSECWKREGGKWGKHLKSLGSYLRVGNVIFGVVSHCFQFALKCDCIRSVTRHDRHEFQVQCLTTFL